MPERTIRVVRDGFPHQMALDTAVSRVLLSEASLPGAGETLRLSIPGRAVAFGKHDTLSPGFAKAVVAARNAGFEPFLRLAGGRAAAFHEGTVAIAWTIPAERPIDGIRERFAAASDLVVDTLAALGVAAAVGAVPGEYCPGEYSVHTGPAKVAGVGQRLTKSAAMIGGVVVVEGGDLVRDALVPVYDALGLEWIPSTAGALSDTVPGIQPHEVVQAMIDQLGNRGAVETASLSGEVIKTAQVMRTEFDAR